MDAPPRGDVLSSTEVGRILDVSIRTVHRRVEDGELRAMQKLPGPKGAWLFHRADVEDYIARQQAMWREAQARLTEGAPPESSAAAS